MNADEDAALAAFLTEELGGEAAQSIDPEPIGGGNANETLAVTWAGEDLIVRLPPAEDTAPEILHDIMREYHVLEAIADTWVPTPTPRAACTDADVLGSHFYVMEQVDGEIIDVAEPPRFREHRRQIGAATVDTLAMITALDVDRLELAALGDPLEPADCVAQYTRQFEWAQERTAEERAVPVLAEVGDWLAANAPPLETVRLTHGDYKPDNLLFASGTPPRISAVLDWELVALGDPRTDLGWLLSYWSAEDDPTPLTDDLRERYADHPYFPLLEVFVNDYQRFMRQPGYHARAELVERFEVQTGIDYSEDRFFRAFGAYKLAAICEGFFRQYLEADEPPKETYPAMEMMVPVLARQARQVIEGDRPLS